MKTIEYKNIVKLPIKTEASVMTECWTYRKLSIIETSPHAEAWLASHMELYFDKDSNLYFGENEGPHGLDYFNDILSFEEIDIWSVKPDQCADMLISEINRGNYILLYISHPRLMIHEIIIHGYNLETKTFYYNELISGKFREIEMTFEQLKEEYAKTFDYYARHHVGMVIGYSFFFPITRFRLKKEFDGDMCLYNAFKKLSSEAEGKTYDILNENAKPDEPESYRYYTGLACLHGMKEHLAAFDRDRRFITDTLFNTLAFRLVLMFNKLFEHRRIILGSMHWILGKVGENEDCLVSVQKYSECCDKMEQLYSMAFKFRASGDWDIFDRILDVFSGTYDTEKEIIEKFRDDAFDLYFEMKKYMDEPIFQSI